METIKGIFERLNTAVKLTHDGTIGRLKDELDFILVRSNYYGNEREMYLYQSFEAMKYVETLCVGLVSFVGIAEVAKKNPAAFSRFLQNMHPLKQGAIGGIAGCGIYHYYSSPFRYNRGCNLEDVYISTIAREVVRRHPKKEELMKIMNFPNDDLVKELFVTNNFRGSGASAILTADVGTGEMMGCKPVSREEYFNDAFYVIEDYELHDNPFENMMLYPEPSYFNRENSKRSYLVQASNTLK